jgi:hypothetical protein
VQVWGVNREVKTGMKQLESGGLEKKLERDATVLGPALELVLIIKVVAL